VKTILLILLALVVLVLLAGLVLYLIGRSLPERHTASLTVHLPAKRTVVWATVTDYAKMPEWWPAVKAVRLETKPGGEIITWNKDSHGQEVGFRTKEEQAPTRLVREIVGDDLPFGGTWTFALEDDGDGTRLRLTEDGFIKPPLFRAVAQYFLKLDATMKDFVVHLEKRVSGAGK
jgi:uncharacterized protein YndB with AHSA1/START domain